MLGNLTGPNDRQFAFVLSRFFVSEQILAADIRRLYEKDELKYYHFCKDMEMDFNHLYQKYPYAQAEQMQICFRMCGYWIQNQQLHKLYPLCKKAFPFAWHYVRVHRRFDGKDFLSKWTKKYPAHDQPLQYLLKSYYIALVLAGSKGYPIQTDEVFSEKTAAYISSVLEECAARDFPHSDEPVSEIVHPSLSLLAEKIRKAPSLLEGFRAVFMEEYQSVPPIAHQVVGKCYCEDCVQTAEDRQVREQLLYEQVIRKGNAQWMKIMDHLFLRIGLDAPAFTAHIPLEQKQWQDFLRFLKEAREGYHLPDSMDLPCCFFYLYTLALHADYQQVRAELYALPSQSVYLSELEAHRQQTDEMRKACQAAEQAYQKIQAENERLHQRIGELGHTLRQAQQSFRRELAEREDFSEEVRALRAHVIRMNREEEVQTLSEEEQLRALRKCRMVIVGGSQQWHQKIQQVLPQAVCIYTDDYIKHQEQLRKSTYVFLNTAVLSHNTYYKLMKFIRKNDLRFFYLKDHRNIRLTVAALYESIFG